MFCIATKSDGAREHQRQKLPQLNRQRKAELDQRNAGLKPGESKKAWAPLARLPIQDIITWALRSSMLNMATDFPAIKFLFDAWLVFLFSQAPTEAAFSKLKKNVTKSRTTLSQEHTGQLMYVVLNGPNSFAGRAVGMDEDEFLESAWTMFCNLQTRRIAAAAAVPNAGGYDLSFHFGQSLDSTAEGKAAMAAADRELESNAAKLVGAHSGDVADYDVGGGAAITAKHVWVDCSTGPGAGDVTRRACLADQAGRTAQVGDDVAVTGLGGQVCSTGKSLLCERWPAARRRGRRSTSLRCTTLR